MRVITTQGSMGLLYRELEKVLGQPLPGAGAQVQLAPQGRVREMFYTARDHPPLQSGVLLLVYIRRGEPTLCYIRRPEYPGIHSGQIAFPGGKCEEDDTDTACTALREAEEETGIPRDQIRLVGPLTPLFIPPSNYMVYPWVAVTNDDPVFNPDPAEVACIVEVPLKLLLMPGIVSMMPPSEAFSFMEVPAYVCNGTVIWGATAMITAEFIELVRRSELDRVPEN